MTTWTRDSKAKAYYFHRFYAHQADLNTSHRVRLEGYGFRWFRVGGPDETLTRDALSHEDDGIK